LELRWTQRYALPYLVEAHGDALTALLDWLERHGGVRLEPALLAHNQWQGPGRVIDALADLAQSVHDGRSPTETRLGFARYLGYGYHTGPAMAVVNAVLANEPGHPPALALKADLLWRMERYAEAAATAEEALAQDPASRDAAFTLALAARQRHDWPRLEAVATRLMELEPPYKWAPPFRAHARLEQGDLPGFEADYARVQGTLSARNLYWRWLDLRRWCIETGASRPGDDYAWRLSTPMSSRRLPAKRGWRGPTE
jgi:tetratricopeptide (TPR) repeat protein